MKIELLFHVLLMLFMGGNLIGGFFVVSQLNAFKKNRSDLTNTLTNLMKSLETAESNVIKLKKNTLMAIEDLKAEIKAANNIRGDLNYLIEKGDKIANTLEQQVRQASHTPPAPGNGQSKQHAADDGDVIQLEEAINAPNPSLSEAKKQLIGRLQSIR